MNPRQEAEKIVEMFKPYADAGNETWFATQAAIKHVEGIINELDYFDTMYSVERSEYWNDIIHELKSM